MMKLENVDLTFILLQLSCNQGLMKTCFGEFCSYMLVLHDTVALQSLQMGITFTENLERNVGSGEELGLCRQTNHLSK